ncbi:metallophosphoesterase [Sulfobacillus thermosulfidooxidans]|uniref:metallophosphoesterase n=1 Tax=Sulfobacillus thermosulfidooxidans TaxID=28034 RepID=UPI001FA91E65|nr:metallophosphoesterase [Sulfobacillus thermosulfidooxidans]
MMVFVITPLLVAGLIFYSAVIEPRWIQFTRYDIAIPNLPKSFDGFSILHLSDFHGRVGAFSFLKKMKITADIVAVTGDLFAWKTLPRSRIAHALDQLRAPEGVYFVSGNHDYRNGRLDVTPWNVGERLLDNRVIPLRRGEDTLWLAGIPDLVKGQPDWEKINAEIPQEAAAILLSHRPDAVLTPYASRFGLILSGHTHGGQVTVCGRFIPVRHTHVGKGYAWGKWIGPKGTVLITSRGLGSSELPIRFGARPQIVYIRLSLE